MLKQLLTQQGKDNILNMTPELFQYRPIPNLNLPDIKETDCFTINGDINHLLVCAEPKKDRYNGGCPECGSLNYHKHGMIKDRYIHDYSIGPTSIDISLTLPRYKCQEELCGITFVYPLESVKNNSVFTNRLYEHIQKRALAEPFAPLAKEYGLAPNTIGNILKEYGYILEKKRILVAPRVLGLDENHLNGRMCGIFTDIENGTLLEITTDNARNTMIKSIESMIGYDKNIKYVTIDMDRGYRGLVEEILPGVKIIVDKFHVFMHITSATEAARKRIFQSLKVQVAKLPDGEDKKQKDKLLTLLGKNAKLFKFGNKSLAEKPYRINLMTELCETFPELNTLRIVKMGAEHIYDAKTRSEAEKYLNEWLKLLPEDDVTYDEFYTFKKTLSQDWKPYILNYFDSDVRYTNAATEGRNRVIKEINTVGKGYGFEVLRYKVLFYCPAYKEPIYARKKVVSDDIPISVSYTSSWSFSFNEMFETREILATGNCTSIEVLLNALDERRLV